MCAPCARVEGALLVRAMFVVITARAQVAFSELQYLASISEFCGKRVYKRARNELRSISAHSETKGDRSGF